MVGSAALGPVSVVRAPGRVNLIGEQTDYNLGLVLPAAIDREIWIAFEPWDRPGVELTSAELNETRSVDFEEADYPSRTGLTARVFVASAVDGAGPLSPGD